MGHPEGTSAGRGRRMRLAAVAVILVILGVWWAAWPLGLSRVPVEPQAFEPVRLTEGQAAQIARRCRIDTVAELGPVTAWREGLAGRIGERRSAQGLVTWTNTAIQGPDEAAQVRLTPVWCGVEDGRVALLQLGR